MFLPSNLSLWYLVSEFFVHRRHKVHLHPTLKCQLNEQIECFCPGLKEGQCARDPSSPTPKNEYVSWSWQVLIKNFLVLTPWWGVFTDPANSRPHKKDITWTFHVLITRSPTGFAAKGRCHWTRIFSKSVLPSPDNQQKYVIWQDHIPWWRKMPGLAQSCF